MKYRIAGTTMQSLGVLLSQGEAMVTEAGGMSWMKGSIDMKTDMPGGLLGGLSRAAMGESVFLTTYTCRSPQGEITFTPEAPGSIVPIELAEGQSILAQRDAFMCAQQSVTLSIHFRKKLGVALFGGEGFILQRVTGPGMAFFEIDGEVVEIDLPANETMRVDPGHIALLEPSVNCNIERIKGVSNILFGGEGLFLATLSGPGKIWLQTMPINNLIAKIVAKIPSKG
ncbi:MAG: TIGR00266 family protein [Anaerolineae bacterium]|nr:TIGR00266 family protein [Anaerolineae bacterium]